MDITNLLLRAGATWLLSYAFTQLDGPMGIFETMREWRDGRWHGRREYYVTTHKTPTEESRYQVKIGGLFDCIICTATWVGVIVMLVPDGAVLQGFGIAGIAMFLHSYSGWKSYS